MKKEKEAKKIERLKIYLRQVDETLKQLNSTEEVLEKEVKPFGNSSHMILPKRYQNKKASIIIRK